MLPRKGGSALPAAWLFVRLVVASLVLLQVGAPLASAPCVTECAEDDADGRCAPACDHCACCGRVPLLAAAGHDAPPSEAEARPVVIGERRETHAGVSGRVFRPPRVGSSRNLS